MSYNFGYGMPQASQQAYQPLGSFQMGMPAVDMPPTDAASIMSNWGKADTSQMFGGGGAQPGGFDFSGAKSGGGWSWFDQLSPDGTKSQGAAAPMLGAAQGLLSAFMGMKQYGLAKDSLAESKRQFGLNYDAQKQTTNTQLEDRQRARVASNSGAYQSVGDYMTTNGIK